MPPFWRARRRRRDRELKIRRCVSAGEALPADIGRRWSERYGVDILDGLGSTEMLHIFLSNRPGEVKYGTTGKPVPGYDLRLVDDDGETVTKRGEMGELQVRGPTSAIMYWNNREQSRATFLGRMDALRRQIYRGRRRLFRLLRPARRHAQGLRHVCLAVRGRGRAAQPSRRARSRRGRLAGHRRADQAQGLRGAQVPDKASDAFAQKLQDDCRKKLAVYKYPRWIEFRTELPKTATGKIQRFKLRAEAET